MILKLRYIEKYRSDLLLFGLFSFFWSLNSYFIGGDFFRYIFLSIGIFSIFISTFTLPFSVNFIKMGIFSFLLLLFYLLLSYFHSQFTFNITVILFDFICYSLFLSGVLIGRYFYLFKIPSFKLIVLICLFCIIGSYFFLKFQSIYIMQELNSNNRNLADSESVINPIGLAYTNVILLFLFIQIFRFSKYDFFTKFLLVLSILSTIFIVISTQSRGALIYALIVYFGFLIRNHFKFRNFPLIFISILGIFLLFYFSFYYLIEFFPFLSLKLEGISNRLLSLISFFESTGYDTSSNERQEKWTYFYNNIDSFIIFGEYLYKPYPHNIFLEIIMRWGLVFGFPILFYLIYFFILCIKFRRFEKGGFVISLLVVFFLFSFFQSLSSLTLDINRGLWIGLGGIYGFFSNSRYL